MKLEPPVAMTALTIEIEVGGRKGKKVGKKPTDTSLFTSLSLFLTLCVRHISTVLNALSVLNGRKMFSRAVAQVARLAARPSMISRYAVAPAAPIALASKFQPQACPAYKCPRQGMLLMGNGARGKGHML